MTQPLPRWPLFLIAAPAAVAIWSGWVGLGGLCGFGPVDLLPGLVHLTVNTAICLPVGVEAFAGYALAVWLRASPVPAPARDFAKASAIGALVLGMLGQVGFHVLAALHAPHAPIWMVVMVSCMPVVVIGLAAALTHLMSAPDPVPAAVPGQRRAARAPGIAAIKTQVGVGQDKARKVQRLIRAAGNGHGGSHD